MKWVFLSLFIACCTCIYAQQASEWQSVVCVSPSDKMAIFTSVGISDKKKEMMDDAKKRLFYALFYKGVAGVNDNAPLIEKDNVALTMPFFDASKAYEAYIIEATEKAEGKKINGHNAATYSITVSMSLLMEYLKKNGMMASVVGFGEEGGPIMPTIMTIPFRKKGESFQTILESNPDMRVAVANVQDGFRSRNVTTYDFFAVLQSNERGMVYEDNQGTADSNDRQLALSSGSDVYVELDLIKDEKPEGNKVTLILKAYETATGAVLASKNVITRRYPSASIDMLTKYAVRDELQSFLNDICKVWVGPIQTVGTRITLRFSLLDGGVIMSFDDKVGPNNYSLSNVVRQWVRKNCYKAQYHLKTLVAEMMLFDSVTMPPTDEDGLPMDAAQFAFLLESYLKETIGVDCSSRVDGNMVLFSIH